VPDCDGIDERQVATLDDYVAGGGALLLTGRVPQGLRCLADAAYQQSVTIDQGGYVRVRPEDRQVLGQGVLADLDLVFLQGPFHVYTVTHPDAGLLRLIPPDMFGPPEKCYYRHVSEHPALLTGNYREGRAACFPFQIGTLYNQQAHQGHAALVVAAVDRLLRVDRRLHVNTSPLVEINHRADRDGQFEWVSLYNHSGALSRAFHAPLSIASVEIRYQGVKPVRSVRSLHTDRELPFVRQKDETISVVLPELQLYDIIVFEY
jgi:hypothetical protein